MKKIGSVLLLAFVATLTSCSNNAEYHSSEFPPTEQHWAQALSESYPQWEAPAYVPANGGVKQSEPAPTVEFLDKPAETAPVVEEVPVTETPTAPTEAALEAQPAASQQLIID